VDNALVVEIVRTTGTAIVAPLAYLLARSVTRRRIAEIATFERRHHPTNITLMVDDRVAGLVDPVFKRAAQQYLGGMWRELSSSMAEFKVMLASIQAERREDATHAREERKAILDALSAIHRANLALGAAVDDFRKAVGS
jgi:hypothetical protein